MKKHNESTLPLGHVSGDELRPVTRPKVGARTCQGVFPIIDSSSSMTAAMFAEVSQGIREIHRELCDLKHKGGLYLGVLEFASTARMVVPIKLATEVAESDLQITQGSCGGWTNFEAALLQANQTLTSFEAMATLPKERSLFLFMTDGHKTSGGDPLTLANKLKEQADIVCVAYGPDADFNLLKQIATHPDNAIRIQSGGELAKYFALVGKTVSRTRGTGMSAALLLRGNMVQKG